MKKQTEDEFWAIDHFGDDLFCIYFVPLSGTVEHLDASGEWVPAAWQRELRGRDNDCGAVFERIG